MRNRSRFVSDAVRIFVHLAILLAASSCGDDDPAADPAPEARALVAAHRGAHLLDRPYPSDELLTSAGTIDLTGFPLAGPSIGRSFLTGWLRQVRDSVHGFSATGAIYFRFDAEPALALRYAGVADDPVTLYSLDSDHRVPIRLRWVTAADDPYLPENTLIVSPDETTPLRSGERYAAVVSTRVALRADGWTPPAELDAVDAAVATVFTVQDHVGELAALGASVDESLAAHPELLVPSEGLREVAALDLTQGRTPSGQNATVESVTFADGSTEVTYLGAKAGALPQSIDLRHGPFATYQATIQTLAFQAEEGRPYQRPGLGIILDTERTDGWIDFGPDAELRTEPHPEPMRIVLQAPRQAEGPVGFLLWAHGSGGDAYEAVARPEVRDDIGGLRAAIAAAGAGIASLDQPLFGRRFPLIDRGYTSNLAIVNVANLPAFRDNVRQGAIDQRVLGRFVLDVLPELGVDVDPGRLRLFGHSIGAQIAGVGAALGNDVARALMINGTGGFITHSVLASDLLSLRGGTTAAAIFGLAGITPPENPTPAAILGALFGVPSAHWDSLDRFHPLGIPFQLVLDAGDPLAVAASHDLPVSVLYGVGDTYVPADGAEWIARASRRGSLTTCAPSEPYDGHFCFFREPIGKQSMALFMSCCG